MDVRILRYFLTVAQEENISRAAEVLHITQPTLSRQIAQLESELGVVLFKRDTRKLTMTSDGLLLRRRAEKIIELIDKVEDDFSGNARMMEGKISIGCGELASVQELARILKQFHRMYPLVVFDIFTGNADTVAERIDRGIIDLGLFLEPVDKSKYEFARMTVRERWVAVMRSDDPLAQKDVVTVDDLKDKPLILPRRLSVQSELANWFGDDFKSIGRTSTSNLNTNGAVMASAGLGYNLCIEGMLYNWNDRHVTYRPLYPVLEATSVIAWKRHQPLNQPVMMLIDFIKQSLHVS